VTVAGQTLTNVVVIAGGYYHGLALRANGTVVGWGRNDSGQINLPASATNVVAIAAGGFHSLALRADGTVVGWGRNDSGQINIPASATNVVAIAAGYYYGLALRADGTVLGWGDNGYGQTTIPASATNVVAIAAGRIHGLALQADGNVLGWGDNGYGQTTIPASATNVAMIATGFFHSLALRPSTVIGWGAGAVFSVPSDSLNYGQVIIPVSATNVVAIAAGGDDSLALRTDGTVVGWGMNDSGQVNIPAGATNVVAIASGGDYSLALRADGTVVGWGHNYSGQATGVPNTVYPYSSSGVVTVAGQTLTNVVAISACADHSLALRTNGTVVGWGSDAQTNIPASATNVIAIAAGDYFSLALRADGTVVGWGSDAQTNIPASATNVIAIAAGSLALRADGTVVGWGNNDHGQTTIPAGATNVVAIAAGAYHSLALRADGTVIGWGDNTFGQATPPACLANPGLSIVTSGTVDPDVPGLYQIVYSATNTDGAVGTATRAVWVTDTLPPTLSLAGANPLLHLRGTPFVDPGATATDVCAGDLTGTIQVSGSVNTNVCGLCTLTYTVTDSSGNIATTNRNVVVATAPSISSLSATPTGTNALSGSPQVRISAGVNPNGLPSQSFFDYGLSTAYPGRIAQTNFPAGFIAITVAADIPLGLVPGATYHCRAVASNEFGVTYSSDQTFTAPLVFAVGDANGDGVVDQGELNTVLSNYSATSPWLYLTNVAGLGGTNVTFALSNSTAGVYSVLMSTNLVNWYYLGPATPRYEFTDTNAPALPQRFYRLRWP
jgi:alpha-tubulin suppressor-like RCC1 family protein